MKQQERSSQVKEVATCYIGRDMKTGIEVLTRKMMSRPPIQVATQRRAKKKKRMSRQISGCAIIVGVRDWQPIS